MGKPFDSELGCLASTYSWAMKKNIDPLTNPIFASASLPLLAVGSGGSFTAAYFTSALYQKYAGKIAKAMTLLELVSSAPQLRDMAVLFLSAGGRNTDIIGAFKQVIMREPRRITVMCASPKSPLSLLADTYRYVDLIDFDLPSGKDGFLATNSLLAFSVLLSRLYATDVDSLINRGETNFWKGAYRTFVQRLEATPFHAVVFDYDGTLCDARDRYRGLGDDIVQHLVQLLRGGLVIGVATGRGKSVKQVLRGKIESTLWSQVVVGSAIPGRQSNPVIIPISPLAFRKHECDNTPLTGTI